MLKPMSDDQYNARCAQILKMYEEAGFTPVECMSDMTDFKAKHASNDGYADGVIAGGVSLIIAGLICKWLSRRELNRMGDAINNKLNYAMSIKPLTDFKIPNGTDSDRDENN